MKLNKQRHITKILAFSLTVGGLTACQDDLLYDGSTPSYDSNAVLFETFVGAPVKTTRGGDDPRDLDPLVLDSDGKRLYLHTYVCDNSFDPALAPSAPSTRGLQVNDMASFRNVHGNIFGIEVRQTDAFDLIDATTATPLPDTGDTPSEVWKVDWTGGNRIYWPANDGMLSFHAWAPTDLTTTGMTSAGLTKTHGAMSFSYTAQKSADGESDAEVQKDLLLAITDASKKRPERTDKGLVELQFTHPLAAVKFAVRDVLEGTVKSITLRNIKSTGDCTYTLNLDQQSGYYIYTRTGKYVWENQSEPTEFRQVFNVDVPDSENEDDIRNNERDEDGDYSITAHKPEATFMMIPQEISADAEIEVVMTQTVFPGKGDLVFRGKIKDNNVTKWEAGKEYVYTISTSSENWTYVFDVKGSKQKVNENKPKEEPFESYASGIVANYSVTEGAFYEVKSYRYRTNNPSIQEPVKWTGTVQYEKGQDLAYGVNVSDNDAIQALITKYGKSTPGDEDGIQMTYTPEEWFPNHTFTKDTNEDGTKDTFGGNGSVGFTKFDLNFKSQYIATDYEGDWQMRATSPETGNDRENPIDLSKRNGGLGVRNTANCYVVNKTGWYAIPLYYGCTVKNGVETDEPYRYNNGVAHAEHGYDALVNFVDYNGKPIKQAKIEGAKDATLVWTDGEDIFSNDEVELRNINGEPFVVFHIKRENLLQANAVVAILDGKVDKKSSTPIDQQANIIWSWHVWISDYLVNGDLVLGQHPEAAKNEIKCKSMKDELHGEPLVDSFTAAPRNLGWCDAKNIGYLKRVGKIKFEQDRPRKESYATSDYTRSLDVEQRGHLITYWIGNNTYYQWGRKDPMVGFSNDLNETKTCFGPLQYDLSDAGVEIGIDEAIKHPHLLYIRMNEINGSGKGSNDWLSEDRNYYNLWNNYRGSDDYLTRHIGDVYDSNNWHEPNQIGTPIQNPDFAYSAVKTVYDPSPAGYVVPPTTFFNVFVSGRTYADYSNYGVTIDKFNGELEQMKDANGAAKAKFYVWKANSLSGTPLLFTPTGQRWDKSNLRPNNGGIYIWSPGYNMNPHIIYLWTNSGNLSEADKAVNGRAAFSFVLGDDGHHPNCTHNGWGTCPGPYVMTTHFNGRKSMARPVRCIREYSLSTSGK